jgi:hypothetical protein
MDIWQRFQMPTPAPPPDGAKWIGIGGARLSLVCFVPHNWPRRWIGATRKLVGAAGFGPATPSSRTRCATRPRYTPIHPISIPPLASWSRPRVGRASGRVRLVPRYTPLIPARARPVLLIMLRTVQDRMGDLHRFVDADLFDDRAGDGLDAVVFEIKEVAVRGAPLYVV